MIFQAALNYYEILEVRPDASTLDIRNAYHRIKAAYRKDNLALYSLMDDSETEEMISKIEEAFQILSDPDSRREYDERNGIFSSIESKIVSIDRVPPMESADENDLLVPPTTDFPMSEKGAVPAPRAAARSAPIEPAASDASDRRSVPGRRSADLPFLSNSGSAGDALLEEIAQETEWRGSFLRKIRELRRLSIDDLANQTKISKTYINAIEEEDFPKLPAAVFVRGFLTQIAKILKVPHDRASQAYMARFRKT